MVLKRFLIISCLCIALLSAGAPGVYGSEAVVLTPEEASWLKAHPVVRISNMMNWAPLDFSQSGRPTGFSMDYARLVAEKVGLKLDFVMEHTWAELLEMGRRKELDMLATINHRPDREAWLLFTPPYLVNNPWGVFARSGSPPVSNIKDLAGRKIAVNRDFAQHTYLKENHPEIILLPVDSIGEGFDAVATLNADGYLTRVMTGNYFIALNLISGIEHIGGVMGISVIGNAPLHLAVRKDWPELASILEKAMDAVTLEEYNRLARKWSAPEVEARVPLTHGERQWLRKHPVITLGTDATWAPFVVQRPDGIWEGLDVDVIHYINRVVGSNIVITTGQWVEIVDMAKKREIDGLSSSSRNAERARHFLFTDSYATEYTLLLVRADDSTIVNRLEDLKGKTIAYQEGNVFAESILSDLKGIRTVPVVSEVAGVKMLVEGAADACMSGVTYYTEYHAKYAGMLKVGWWFHDRPLQIVFSIRKDWPELVSIINKALASMPMEKKGALIKQWFGMGQEEVPGRKGEGEIPMAGEAASGGAVRLILTGKEKEWLKQHPVVTLGGGIFPPLDFVDEAGKTSGLGPDYVDRLGEMLGIRFKHVSGEWADIFDMVKRKEIDGIRLVSGNDIRRRYLNFTEPLTVMEYALFLPKGAKAVTSLDAMDRKSVAVLKGAYPESYIAGHYPGVLRMPVASYREGLQAVMQGRVDGMVGMRAGISHIMGLNFKRGLSRAVILPDMSENLGIGLRNDWPELATILDKGLASLSGETRQEIHRQWTSLGMAEDERGGSLTSEETRWLAGHREIRFGMAPAWAPYDFLDEAGEHAGVVSEIAALVNSELGRPLKPVHGMTRAQSLEKLKAGELDVIVAIARSEEREDACLFTEPYLKLPLGLITRDDFRFVGDVAWMEEARVAVVTGSVVGEYLARDHPELEFVACADMQEALGAVSEGRADVLVGVYAVAEHARRKLGLSNLRVTAPTPYMYEISMAVRSDWPELVHILDKKLAEISEFDKLLMLERWMAVEEKVPEKRDYKGMQLLSGILLVGVILAGCYPWIRRRVVRSGK